jgi:hypothetical protein
MHKKIKDKIYLYHMVPSDMKGNILYPLNSLKDIYPQLYSSKILKYNNRKHIMEQFIPTLKCKWNDVLQFTSINPKKIKKLLIEVGAEPKEMKFYKIDSDILDPNITTIYLYQEKTNTDKMNPKNFIDFNLKNLTQQSSLPQITQSYYKEKIKNNEKILLFAGTSQILHRGTIDISNTPTITV